MTAATPRGVLAATAAAFLLAAVALVAFVLPAEYGVDPLGSGRAMGLLALAPAEPEALADASAGYVTDTVTFELDPFESIEYKYRLAAGDGLVFSWRATGQLVAELHGEPDAAPAGVADSFELTRAAGRRGTYQAPFAGWHGWFWQNRGTDTVSVTLEAAGFFPAARIYHGGRVQEVPKGTLPGDE